MEGGWEFFYSLLAGDGEGPCRSLMPFEVPAIIIKPEREGPRQWIMPFEVPGLPVVRSAIGLPLVAAPVAHALFLPMGIIFRSLSKSIKTCAHAFKASRRSSK